MILSIQKIQNYTFGVRIDWAVAAADAAAMVVVVFETKRQPQHVVVLKKSTLLLLISKVVQFSKEIEWLSSSASCRF
jgi:hypothetical protein